MTSPRCGAVEAAGQAAESIRELNYLTGPFQGAWELAYPCDVYRVINGLSLMAARLPQTFNQLAGRLRRQLEDDAIEIEAGEFSGDPHAAVGVALSALAESVRAAEAVERSLDCAKEAVAWASSTEHLPEPTR